MTAPTPSGGPSPLRVGGLALLGAGAVAAVIGIGTLVTGGGDSSSTATAPTSTVAPLTPPTSTPAPASPAVSVPVFPPTNAIAAPTAAPGADGSGATGGSGTAGGSGSSGGSGTAGGSGAAGGSGGQTVVKSPVRVYNNSTITGLAARAAEDFRSEGWTVTAVSNYPSGNIPTSTVYYRTGTAEQAGAQAMGKEFGMRVEPRFTGLDEASPGLIVIVTNDYQKRG